MIILISPVKYQHYLTLLGYSDKSFYVYDSFYQRNKNDYQFTKDDNGDLPGNRNIENENLIIMWDKGGMFGLYKNYGLECYK